jgi:hypothetical protein
MDHDRDRERDDVVVEEEHTREGDATVDRSDVLEGVVPDITSEPQSAPRPDFARGQAENELRLESTVTDRFSRGQEEDPTLHEQVHEGDFAAGQADRPGHAETTLDGRFARGQQSTDPDSPNDAEDVGEAVDRARASRGDG